MRWHKLWRGIVPREALCPVPSRRRVLQKLKAELPRPLRLRRTVQRLAAAAAVLTLLTATAAGTVLSEYSVFNGMLRQPSEYALSLVDREPKSVRNNGYILTVTSSVADDSEALFTLEIRPETEEARAFLASEGFEALTTPESVRGRAADCGPIALSASWIGWETLSIGRERYNPETDSVRVDVSMNMGIGLWRQVSVHLNTMDDDVWLRFGVNRVPSAAVEFAGAGEGPGVYKVRLSPLSVWMEFAVEETEWKSGEGQHTAGRGRAMPHVSVLEADGTLANLWEIDAGGASGSGRSGDGVLWHYEYYWRFGSIQDFGEVVAVVYDGTVYPLNGGESYPLEGV